MKKLAVITTHPIQYYAPVFKLLTDRKNISVKVFYTWGKDALNKYDPGFNKQVAWDIPLLEGYNYEWAVNTATDPGSHHRKGIITPGLINQVEAYKADAVLVIGWAYVSHLQVIRYFKNKLPVYFRGDSNLLDDKKGWRSWLKTMSLKWVYKHIDHAFYTGTNNKAYYKKYGLKDKQLSFTPHAVDNDRFAISRKTEADQLRSDLGIAPDEVLILFAGKFEEKKSPQLLLKAFLSANILRCHLLFAGDGELGPALKLQANGHPAVHFVEFSNQNYMPVIYQSCDIFCLPSKGPAETWGLAVNEAMACSKAVLVSDKCGCAVDLVSGKNGGIFESENLNELITYLKALTADLLKLTELGRQSASVITDWNFTHIAEAVEKQILNETNRPDKA